MKLHDAIFSWLQMKIVSEARPHDRTAKETLDFFAQILQEDHQLCNIRVDLDGTVYRVGFEQGGQLQMKQFDREWAEQLLADINANPKYNE